jgi:hypothetical protein
LRFKPVVRLTAQPVPSPTGWTAARSGANWIYTPTNIAAAQTFALTIEPVQALGGQDMDRWLVLYAQADVSRRDAGRCA